MMKQLAPDASDEELLQAVEEWVRLLAEERYQDAYDFLYHPWMPEYPENEHDADALRSAVTTYGWGEPHPYGPFVVTPVETASTREDRPNQKPYQDIAWRDMPEEEAWDSLKVERGGTPSGASILGDIHFDLPLNGQWSDLTAIFQIVLYDGSVVLALENIDVL